MRARNKLMLTLVQFFFSIYSIIKVPITFISLAPINDLFLFQFNWINTSHIWHDCYVAKHPKKKKTQHYFLSPLMKRLLLKYEVCVGEEEEQTMVNWQGTLFLGFVNEKWKDGGRTNPKLFVVISKVQIQEGGGDGIHFVFQFM